MLIRLGIALLAVGMLSVAPARADMLHTTRYIMNIPAGFSEVATDVVNEHCALMHQRMRQVLPEDAYIFNGWSPAEHAFSPWESTSAPLPSPHLLVDEVLMDVEPGTALTVQAAKVRSKISKNLAALSGDTPFALHSLEDPANNAFYIEYLVTDAKTGLPEVHAFRVALSTKGVVVAYWYAIDGDYTRYVTSLRPAAMSLKFLPQ